MPRLSGSAPAGAAAAATSITAAADPASSVPNVNLRIGTNPLVPADYLLTHCPGHRHSGQGCRRRLRLSAGDLRTDTPRRLKRQRSYPRPGASRTGANQRKRNYVKRWRAAVALVCSVSCDLAVLAPAGGGARWLGVG